MPRRLFCLVLRSLLTPNCHIEARSRARNTSMTKRSTRRAAPLAIACAWLALAGFVLIVYILTFVKMGMYHTL